MTNLTDLPLTHDRDFYLHGALPNLKSPAEAAMVPCPGAEAAAAFERERAAELAARYLSLAYPEGAETARRVLDDLQAPVLATAAGLVSTLELTPRPETQGPAAATASEE